MSFEVAAEAYDRFMGRYSRGLSAQLADLAGVGPGRRVLDVGCGPGALLGELVGRVGVDRVAAVDPPSPSSRPLGSDTRASRSGGPLPSSCPSRTAPSTPRSLSSWSTS